MHVLALTIAAVALYGWASRSDAEASGGNLVSTAAVVDTALNGDGYDAIGLRDELEAQVTDDTRAHATRIRQYAIELADHDTSDYAHQLRVAATGDTVGQRHFATLVSAVDSHQRHLQHLAVRAATATSTWQGMAGDKVCFDAKILTHRTHNQKHRGSQTPVTTVYLADISGNLYTWHAPKLNDLPAGTFVHVTGRIKGHDSIDDHNQTEITRCVLTPIAAPPEWPSPKSTAAPATAAPTAGSPHTVAAPESPTATPAPTATSMTATDPQPAATPGPETVAARHAQIRAVALNQVVDVAGTPTQPARAENTTTAPAPLVPSPGKHPPVVGSTSTAMAVSALARTSHPIPVAEDPTAGSLPSPAAAATPAERGSNRRSR